MARFESRRVMLIWLSAAALALAAVVLDVPAQAADKIKILIVDGQNNHNWRQGTPAMKWILEQSGRFEVDVSTTPGNPPRLRIPRKASKEEKARLKKEYNEKKAQLEKESAAKWDAWRPKFSDYGVVLLNYTGKSWPQEVNDAFVAYVKGGGGVVVVHAADNAFGKWVEYNEIIGLGGWGGRNEKSGPYVRWRDGKTVIEQKPGPTAGHGPRHEFVVETRTPDHPIMKGMPAKWKHAVDELYMRLRGPAKNLTLLATAFASKEKRGSGEHEPVMFTISYGQGRIFHTVLGHDVKSMSGVGFQLFLLRGSEWAATGEATIKHPQIGELNADTAAMNQAPSK